MRYTPSLPHEAFAAPNLNLCLRIDDRLASVEGSPCMLESTTIEGDTHSSLLNGNLAITMDV
jgi:hypothetical protein